MDRIEEEKLSKYFFDALDRMIIEDKIVVEVFKNQYLARRCELVSSIYILIQGTVITSLTGTDGSIFNLAYINKPGIVSLLMDEDEKFVEQPFDIRIDSTKAVFYKIDRVKFWELVNNDILLHKYVKNYYRRTINENNYRLIHHASQNKAGQVYSFLYQCIKLFGNENKEKNEILINHRITQKTIGEFCGIRSRSSVTRIINKLVRQIATLIRTPFKILSKCIYSCISI